MKLLPLLPFLPVVLCSSLLYGQATQDIPDFGNVNKAELQAKECDFDKNAEAMVLFDVEELVCIIDGYSADTKITRHIRIKILNDKGLDEANIHIPYYSYRHDENVSNIRAQTYNLDASGNVIVTKLEKKAIYRKDLNKKLSEVVFSFPVVRAGSIIEYTYTMEGDVGDGLDSWSFQGHIPVKLSRFIIDFPVEIEVHSDPICSLPMKAEDKQDRFREVKTFTMTDVPALRDEPFISCEGDYVQRVESQIVALHLGSHRINLLSTWQEIIKKLLDDDDFGRQLHRNIPRTADLEEQLTKTKDPYQRMTTIYRYVRNAMAWDGHDNIWAIEGVRSAWKDKKGTSGEINLILINLLQQAGLNAQAILLSTRENGKINTMHPGYWQFDKVMARVTIQGKRYILDATNKYASPRLIPWEVMSSEGLLIGNADSAASIGQWGWTTLWSEDQTFKDEVLVNATIDEHGLMSGDATVISHDYSREARVSELKKGREEFVKKHFKTSGSSVRIDSFTVENEDVDTLPLEQQFLFKQSLASSGGYSYFSANLFAGLETNPFTADKRSSDIFFGANRKIMINGNFTIPDGYVFDDLPKNIKMIMPDTSIVFTRLMQADGDQLVVNVSLDFRKPIFTIDEYAYFREFYQKLFDFLNEQIIIKKSAASTKSKS